MRLITLENSHADVIGIAAEVKILIGRGLYKLSRLSDVAREL